MKVNGVESLVKQLKAIRAKTVSKETVIVGYTQNYAIYVHENMTARHAPGKRAKYLEGPARTLKPELAQITRKVFKETGSMAKSLLLAGLRLQRASQEIVPIDTGALRASAFTALEKDYVTAWAAAYDRSQALRDVTSMRKDMASEMRKA